MKETNFKKIQELAITFAYLPIEPNPTLPFFVSHPYLEAVPTMLPREDGEMDVINPLTSEDDLRRFTDRLVQLIQKTDTPIKLFLLLRRTYCFTFLDHIKAYLSNDDLAECLRFVWKDCEDTNSDSVFSKKTLVGLFQRSTKDKLMDDEDLSVYQKLPDHVIVFRGVTSVNDKDVKVFSWTLSRKRAEWFAARYNDRTQKVFQAILPREGILAYFSGEEESIANPFMLENVVEYQHEPK